MRKLLTILVLLAVQFCARGQVTNFNNFTPVRMTVTRVNDPTNQEQGIFVRFPTDSGRVYRLESSTTLTNWTLVKQLVGDGTNASFWFPITNMTVFGSGTNGGGGPLPSPGGNSLMMANAGIAPLPYPWEPVYNPEMRAALAGEGQSMLLMEGGAPQAGDAFQTVHRFYRVVCPEDRIQFPQWQDFIEQYLYFDVWSSLTGRTYKLELWGDGTRVFATTNTVPASGRFGVRDGNYNPNNWPYAGYYAQRDWRLRVEIDVPSAEQGNAVADVRKTGRRRNQNRSGITVSQAGVLGGNVGAASQEEFDQWMQHYFLSCFNGAYQVDLNGTYLEPLPQSGAIPVIRTIGDWVRLRRLIMDTNNYPRLLTDMHYFGHGSPNGMPGITLAQLQASGPLYLDPMQYAVLDGCRIAETFDVLKALIGSATTTRPRETYRANGWIVRFGWGWNNEKRVLYFLQGTLVHAHFEFIADYYDTLTFRPFPGSYLLNTFEDAITFAKNPMGASPYDPRQTNPEGNGLKYMGCADCFFDE
jgi:hypothetical protein